MDFKYENFEFWIDKLAMKGMLFIAVSGAHAYGWAREDSDLDIRQVWFPDLAQAVSVFFKAKTKSWTNDSIDFMSYPISSYLGLLAKGNGNIAENLFQEKIYGKKRLVRELQKIVLENLHTGFLKHYWGYSISLFKDAQNKARVIKYGIDKLLLCRYRVLLAGLIVEEHREIVYNLQEQHKYLETENCLELLETYKNEGKTPPRERTDAMIELADLHRKLEKTIETTNLPSNHVGAPTVQLERWLTKYYQ